MMKMMMGGRGPFGRGFGDFGGGFGGWDDESGGRGGRGGGRGRGRMFAGGELRLVLLRLVAEQDRHGYELIKAIEELTGGEYAPSPGVVYPTLSLLVDEGLLAEVAGEGSRKAFTVTEAGARNWRKRRPKPMRWSNGSRRSANSASGTAARRCAGRCTTSRWRSASA
jgi:DNA-binding PadR family transcriptional regulator